jgi:hypothetical protein
MMQSNSDEDDEVQRLAESMGLPYQVYISSELKEQLKPNEFLSGLGIQYLDRIAAVLGLLKGHMLPQKAGLEDAVPKDRQIIPFNLAKGPYIKEELVSIKAELTDDGGGAVITLKAIPKEE